MMVVVALLLVVVFGSCKVIRDTSTQRAALLATQH